MSTDNIESSGTKRILGVIGIIIGLVSLYFGVNYALWVHYNAFRDDCKEEAIARDGACPADKNKFKKIKDEMIKKCYAEEVDAENVDPEEVNSEEVDARERKEALEYCRKKATINDLEEKGNMFKNPTAGIFFKGEPSRSYVEKIVAAVFLIIIGALAIFLGLFAAMTGK